jgi:hypothetical protein
LAQAGGNFFVHIGRGTPLAVSASTYHDGLVRWFGRWRLAFVCALVALAHADDTPCGLFRVAFYEYRSFYFQTDAGAYVGIDKDVIDALASHTGCQFDGFLNSRVRTWQQMAVAIWI